MGIIRKTPTSRKDYREIWDYVAQHGDLDTADRLLDSFDTALTLLSEHPHAGVARPELRDRLRSFPVGNYIVFYTPLRNGIELVRVLHGARDLRRIFKR